MMRHAVSLARPLLLATSLLASGCTTFLEPTTCPPAVLTSPPDPASARNHSTQTTACGGIHDARFCDYIAREVAGADCAALGVVASKHFCVVTQGACVNTSYAVKGRDCRVVRYETVRDNAFAEECSPGSPFLLNR